MVRKVEVVVPCSHADKIQQVLTRHHSVHHILCKDCVDPQNTPSMSFTFKVVNKKCQELIDILVTYGVSTDFGTLDVTALATTKPNITTIKQNDWTMYGSSDPSFSTFNLKKKKRKYAVYERLAFDEMHDAIDESLHLTFDYLALTVCGGIIAAIGLLNDSAVVVVASMLVSPLMGPIVGMTFGFVVADWPMFWKSFRNEFIGIALLWATGAAMGFVTAPFMDDPLHRWMIYGDNTQMQSRGTWIGLGWGSGIAAPSGVALMLGVSNDAFLAVIGVAIAAALLPPIANSGLCMASSVVWYISPKYGDDIAWQWMISGIISMLLFLINWGLIFILGIWTFRIKRLHQTHDDEERKIDLGKWLETKELSLSKELKFAKTIPFKSKHIISSNTPLLLTDNTKYDDDGMIIGDDEQKDDDQNKDEMRKTLNELQNKINFLMSKIQKEDDLNDNINNNDNK